MLTFWKQLVLNDHDYCSQLWNPSRTGEIQSLELLQRGFLRKIRGVQHLSYWQQLQHLKVYSLERRRERYIAIYIWKVLEGLATNMPGQAAISSKTHPRRGRECFVPNVAPSATKRVKAIRYASFRVKGPNISNSYRKL